MPDTNGNVDINDINITNITGTLYGVAKSAPIISLCAVYGRVAVAVFRRSIPSIGNCKNCNDAPATERTSVGNLGLDSRLDMPRFTESLFVDYAAPIRARAELEAYK
jgi:hypothetical protein